MYQHIKINLINIEERSGDFVSNFAYPILNEYKKDIVSELISSNIEVRPLIAGDMSQKPMWYEQYGHVNLPNCRIVNQNGFYIPNHQDLKTEDVLNICRIINKYV